MTALFRANNLVQPAQFAHKCHIRAPIVCGDNPVPRRFAFNAQCFQNAMTGNTLQVLPTPLIANAFGTVNGQPLRVAYHTGRRQWAVIIETEIAFHERNTVLQIRRQPQPAVIQQDGRRTAIVMQEHEQKDKTGCHPGLGSKPFNDMRATPATGMRVGKVGLE